MATVFTRMAKLGSRTGVAVGFILPLIGIAVACGAEDGDPASRAACPAICEFTTKLCSPSQAGLSQCTNRCAVAAESGAACSLAFRQVLDCCREDMCGGAVTGCFTTCRDQGSYTMCQDRCPTQYAEYESCMEGGGGSGGAGGSGSGGSAGVGIGGTATGGAGGADPCPGPDILALDWDLSDHLPWIAPDGTLYGLGNESVLRYCTEAPDVLPGMGMSYNPQTHNGPAITLSDGHALLRLGRQLGHLDEAGKLLGVHALPEDLVEPGSGIAGAAPRPDLQVDAQDRVWIVTGSATKSSCDFYLRALDRTGSELGALRSDEFCRSTNSSSRAVSLQVAGGIPYAILSVPAQDEDGYDIRRIELSGASISLVPSFSIPPIPKSSSGRTLRSVAAGNGDFLRFNLQFTGPVTTPGHTDTITSTLEHWDPVTGALVSNFEKVRTSGVILDTGFGLQVATESHVYAQYYSTAPSLFQTSAANNEYILVFDRASGAVTGVLGDTTPRAPLVPHPNGFLMAGAYKPGWKALYGREHDGSIAIGSKLCDGMAPLSGPLFGCCCAYTSPRVWQCTPKDPVAAHTCEH